MYKLNLGDSRLGCPSLPQSSSSVMGPCSLVSLRFLNSEAAGVGWKSSWEWRLLKVSTPGSWRACPCKEDHGESRTMVKLVLFSATTTKQHLLTSSKMELCLCSPLKGKGKNSGSSFWSWDSRTPTRALVQKHSGSTVSTTNESDELTIQKNQCQWSILDFWGLKSAFFGELPWLSYQQSDIQHLQCPQYHRYGRWHMVPDAAMQGIVRFVQGYVTIFNLRSVVGSEARSNPCLVRC